MNFNDRPEFAKKLKEMAKVVGRFPDDEDVKAYFNQLEEFPIGLITKAMDKALRDRDPNDVFLKTALVTVPEIREAIDELIHPQEGEEGTVSKCKKCNGNGWITIEDKLRRVVASPCECLYEEAKRTLKKKGKPGLLDGYRKRIISAYEYHQKEWEIEK